MPTCKGIVGNVGSVYFGKSRADAQKTYQSYVESSKEHLGAQGYAHHKSRSPFSMPNSVGVGSCKSQRIYSSPSATAPTRHS
jgi:hypothetical protein